MKTARKPDFQVFRTENMSRFSESGPHVPLSVFSMPLKPPSVALGRSPGKRGKPAICSRTSPPWHLGRRGANGVAVLIQ